MYDASAALAPERSAGKAVRAFLANLPWSRGLGRAPTLDAPVEPKGSAATLAVVDQASIDALAHVQPPSKIAWVEPSEPVALFALRTFGLTLATFGAYAFWARVENRQRLLGAVEIDGKRLSYHGRGIEGFVSFLVAAVLTVVGVTSFFVLARAKGIDVSDLAFGSFRWQRLWITLPLLFLLGSVTYRKRHHILKRLQLGGSPFRLTGEAWSYAWLHFWTAFLVPLTVGLAAPWRAMRLERRKINEMAHGPIKFRYLGRPMTIYKSFACVWLGGGVTYLVTVIALAIVVGPELVASLEARSLAPLKAPGIAHKGLLVVGLGLIPFMTATAIYRAVWVRHQISSIGFAGGQLKLDLPILRFAVITLVGTIVKLVTFGAAGPVVDQIMMRLAIQNLQVEGSYPDFDGRAPDRENRANPRI